MPRQTSYSLEKLISLLPGAKGCDEATPRDGLPQGCIVNEIGEIFWANGPDSKKAETQLVVIISGVSKALSWIAWKYLIDGKVQELSPEARAAITEYERLHPES